MKKAAMVMVLLVWAGMAGGLNQPVINPEDLSLKAGPTEPGEGLSMAWLEAYVYPKEVEEEGVISLGVRTTARVKAVEASFDFSSEKVSLSSYDGMSWSGVFKIPQDMPAGLHVVRYGIKSKRGSIQRTVEFFVQKESGLAQQDSFMSAGEIVHVENWPLTILSECVALSGDSVRVLRPGTKVTGISKLPWYEVIFEDGKEGWVSAAMVREPLEDFHQQGYHAYQKNDFASAIRYYRNAVAIEPEFVKGHFWLAKSYLRKGDLEAAYRSIKEAMRLDERNINCRVFADNLALRYYDIASAKLRAGRYHEAVAAYQKVLGLKPTSVTSWIELGKCYKGLGRGRDARSAWQEALALDPENKDIYALLKMDPGTKRVVAAKTATKKKTKILAAAKKKAPAPAVVKLPGVVADDSVAIVKAGTTGKGTRIDSALRSVIALTKSLGTPVIEQGWQTRKQGKDYLVRFLCEQGEGVLEAFEWSVDVDSKRVQAANDNARLLMDRW